MRRVCAAFKFAPIFWNIKFNSRFTSRKIQINFGLRLKDAGHAAQIWLRKICSKKTEIKRNFSRFFHGVKSEIIYIIYAYLVILNLTPKALEIGIRR